MSLQDLIDTINEDPSQVREALELIKRQLPAYPAATDAEDGDFIPVTKSGGLTERLPLPILDRRGVTPLPDITALSSLNTDALVDGQAFNRLSWRPGSEYGASSLVWDATLDRSNHDGINVFAPNVTPPTDFSVRQQRREYRTATPAGTGCFVVKRKPGQPVTLLDAGAVPGDDSTYELQDLLATGRLNCDSGEGEFLVDEMSTLSTMGQCFRTSEGGSLRATTAEMTVLRIAANDCTVGAEIDCDDLARIGVEVVDPSAGYEVRNCKIKNVRSESSSAFGVVSRSGLGGYIGHNEIRGVFALGDGVSGNGPGLSRAIQYVPAFIPNKRLMIEHNRMFNIYGEEGDVISVQNDPSDWDGIYPFPNALTTIRNNYGENYTRRGLKIQASFTHIADNEFRTEDDTETGLGQGMTISLIASSDCTVRDNEIDCGFKYNGMNSDGSNVTTNERNYFIGNIIKNVRPDGTAISIRQSRNCAVSGGAIYEGPQSGPNVALSNAEQCSVDSVHFFGGVTNSILVGMTTECVGCSATDNKSFVAEARRFIQAPALRSMVTGNKSFGTKFNAGVITGDATASEGSYIKRNLSIAPQTSMLINLASSESRVAENISMDGSSWGVNGEVYWCNGSPVTARPNLYHERGSVAWDYTAVSGDYAGHFCVASGTPGAWQPFALIT